MADINILEPPSTPPFVLRFEQRHAQCPHDMVRCHGKLASFLLAISPAKGHRSALPVQCLSPCEHNSTRENV